MSDHSVRHVRTADGTTLGVRDIPGDGNVIVALHGFTGNGSTMLPLVERVRNGRPAILIDMVGHGESDAPAHVEPYNMSSVVDQVLSIIGHREPGTVHLLGYSMGGRIAFSMAARAPWYFASLTTLSSTPGIEDPVARAERYDTDQALADRIEHDGLDAFCDWWLSLPMFSPMLESMDETQREATRAQRLTSNPLGLANSLRGTGAGAMPPVWHALGSLRCPVLAVAGEIDDRYVAIARDVERRAPFGASAVIPDAGHGLHVENPEEVSRVLEEFLRGCDSSTLGDPTGGSL